MTAPDHGPHVRHVTNETVTLPIEHSGPAHGAPVLLLHGWPQNARSWDRVIPHLHAAGLRTVVPSLRGATPDAAPRARTAYRPARLLADVVAIIDDVGEPVHLVGHDWGAALAWTVTTRRPDLVRTLTAVSVPHPAAFMHAILTSRQVFSSWYMFVFQLPVLPELLLRRESVFARFLRRAGQDAESAARDAGAAHRPGVLRGGINWYRGFVLSRAAAAPATDVPVLQVWSDGDVAVRRSTVTATSRHARGPYTFEELTGVSHWIPDEAPAELSGLICDHLGRGSA